MLINQDFVSAFESFESRIQEEGISIRHSGYHGTVYSVKEYMDCDAGADEDWSNHLDGLGLTTECSLDDCVAGSFPTQDVTLFFSLELDTRNSAVQDDNSLNELKRILQGVLTKIEEQDPNDTYISDLVLDCNGNPIGSVELTIEPA